MTAATEQHFGCLCIHFIHHKPRLDHYHDLRARFCRLILANSDEGRKNYKIGFFAMGLYRFIQAKRVVLFGKGIDADYGSQV